MRQYLIRLCFFTFASLFLLGSLLDISAAPQAIQQRSDDHYTTHGNDIRSSLLTPGIDHEISLAHIYHLISRLAAETDSAGGKQYIFWHFFSSSESYSKLLTNGVSCGKVNASPILVKDIYLIDCVFLI